MASSQKKIAAFGALAKFILSRCNTPLGAATSALSAGALAVAHDPSVLQDFGAGLPVVQSLESAVGQIVLIGISLVLFLIRGKGATDETGTVLKSLAVAMFLIACVPAPTIAQTASAAPTLTFTWTLATTREDGSPILPVDFASCQLYDLGASATVLAPEQKPVVTWAVGTSGKFTASGGTRRYVLTCTDKFGNESALSNIVTISMSRPTKASNLQVKVEFKAVGP